MVFYCFLSGECSKDPNHPDYVPSIFSFKKNTGKKKEDSFNWFERFTKRQARSLDADDDEITPETLESTRLEEDLSRWDTSTNRLQPFDSKLSTYRYSYLDTRKFN